MYSSIGASQDTPYVSRFFYVYQLNTRKRGKKNPSEESGTLVSEQQFLLVVASEPSTVGINGAGSLGAFQFREIRERRK